MSLPRLSWIAGAALLASSAPVSIAAQELAGYERILDYHSQIVVAEDGSMTVTETIAVEAHGSSIRHGIYRDFPTSYRGPFWTRVEVPFELLSVERNGESEPFHTESQMTGVRVYVGSEDRLVEEGIHTYTLTYRTDRQLGFFEDHDELYWNVTGNDWAFPVEQARASVVLPAAIPRSELTHEGYTGIKGTQGRFLTSAVDAFSGEVRFATTQSLSPGEGLTIVVGFPKGYVPPPTREQQWAAFVAANKILAVGCVGLLGVLLYYLVAWVLVGRDPRRGTIIPLFEPPMEMPPACVRYVSNMRYDPRCFTAAVVNMAVKGYLRIEDDDGDYALERLNGNRALLSAGERRIATHLLSSRRFAFQRSSSTASRMKKAILSLREVLRLEYQGKMFVVNRGWMIAGLVLSGITVLASILVGPPMATLGGGFIMLWLTFWTFGVVGLLSKVVAAWRQLFQTGRGAFERIGAGIAAVFFTAFSIPFVIGEMVGLGFLAFMTSVWMIPILLTLVGINFLFFHLLKQPTRSGRRVMDAIDGFKMYLETAEGDSVRGMRPPELTPELFERFLPYAIALDVENEWSERFEEVLADSGRSVQDHRPGWYGGNSWTALGATGFASAVGTSMASAISSASVAPGSSSGGGGGGSSGGGGGGGGGGGW